MGEARRTVHSQITERSTSRALNFRVLAAEEKQDGVKSVPTNWTDFFLRNLCKRECGTPLQVYIV